MLTRKEQKKSRKARGQREGKWLARRAKGDVYNTAIPGYYYLFVPPSGC